MSEKELEKRLERLERGDTTPGVHLRLAKIEQGALPNGIDISAMWQEHLTSTYKEGLSKQFAPRRLWELMRAEQLAMRGEISGLKGEINGIKGEITAIALSLGLASMDIKIIKADYAVFDFSKHLERFSYFGRAKDPTVQREIAQKKLRKAIKLDEEAERTGDPRARFASRMKFEDAQKHLAIAKELEAKSQKAEKALAGLENRVDRVERKFRGLIS
ncbi:hypothetical protein [Actinocorallia libanotica]|uniref:DUF3486 family protein n=1 Tax=Actinocorallia libanotica TaxID=46162 RepID=A0ABN1Q6S8_9ACTN